MHKALIFTTPTKDLQDLTFLPFKYKTSKAVKDGNLRFAKIIQMTQAKMIDTDIQTVNGIAPLDMAKVLGDILEKCPHITHIAPTRYVVSGRSSLGPKIMLPCESGSPQNC